ERRGVPDAGRDLRGAGREVPRPGHVHAGPGGPSRPPRGHRAPEGAHRERPPGPVPAQEVLPEALSRSFTAATIALAERPWTSISSAGLPERGISRTARMDTGAAAPTAAATASPIPPQALWSSTVTIPRVSFAACRRVASSRGFTE